MDGNDDLPSEFDVIVVGTGMVESIIAASASRVGKTVLHLDKNMYYGGVWATLGLESLEDFAKAYCSSEEKKDLPLDLNQSEFNFYTLKTNLPVSNLVYKWFIPKSRPEEIITKEIQTVEGPKSLNDENNKDNMGDIEADKPPETPSVSSEVNVEGKSITVEENCNECQDEKFHQGDTAAETGSKENIAKEEAEPVKLWSVDGLRALSRKFNIDLAPKVIYSGGSMVESLLRSGVHRYTEFQSVSKILAYMDDCGLEEVPCTKSQVFSCKTFSIIDKRILMKTLNYCVLFGADTEPQYDELKDERFVEVLKRKNTPDHLINYILHSVAMSTCSTPMLEATARIKLFFNNVGRYGHSPFLWPLYGSGELLQAFCRLSAVYGGIYYLGRGAEAVLESKENSTCCGVMSNNKLMKAQHVVTSAYSCPSQLCLSTSKNSTFISRTVLFTDRPLHEKTAVNTKESIVMLHMPCKDSYSTTPVEIIQLPSLTGSCPKQLYVVQVTCEQKQPCWAEVKEVIDKLFVVNNSQEPEIVLSENDENLSRRLLEKLDDSSLKDWFSNSPIQNSNCSEEEPAKPRILFAFHYDVPNTQNIAFSEAKPKNLYFCHGPDTSIDFDRSVKQAKEIFTQMYPEEEFLEPTPDPNDITLSDLIGEDTSTDQQLEEDKSKNAETPPKDEMPNQGDPNTEE